ncbi:MAG: DUF2252 family protein [Solirubrobacteraceae bacterium]
MTAGGSFVEVTAAYEHWRASRIPTVEADLETKHQKLAESPFTLLRGTYYRFLGQFGELLPDPAAAPVVVAVGDLHIENFGTWRDRDGRLAWGVNDFDEIDVLPYTVDLVRLATSASLAITEGHLKLEPADAAAAILHGWRERVKAGVPEPFVLGERHPHVYKLASEAFVDPVRFERRLRALPAYDGGLPRSAAELLDQVVPARRFRPSLHRRVAGVGSLGARRIVALGESSGGLLVREAKQIPGPASMWLWNRRPPRGLTGLVARSQGVAADPFRIQSGKWVVRRLAPDMARLELTTLRRKHDEGAILRSMGAEAANIHLVSHKLAARPKALSKDETTRGEDWLAHAAKRMVELTVRDHREWAAAVAAKGARASGKP